MHTSSPPGRSDRVDCSDCADQRSSSASFHGSVQPYNERLLNSTLQNRGSAGVCSRYSVDQTVRKEADSTSFNTAQTQIENSRVLSGINNGALSVPRPDCIGSGSSVSEVYSVSSFVPSSLKVDVVHPRTLAEATPEADWTKRISRFPFPVFSPPQLPSPLKPHFVPPPPHTTPVSYFPANFPQHAAYGTGIPENLSPPPAALSVGFKYGLTTTPPLTPPKALRPVSLGYCLPASDRDDDTRSTSSVSSSLSSGSTPSPRRLERVTSQADVSRGYSTSTPSPMTSPSSHGQLSPRVSGKLYRL